MPVPPGCPATLHLRPGHRNPDTLRPPGRRPHVFPRRWPVLHGGWRHRRGVAGRGAPVAGDRARRRDWEAEGDAIGNERGPAGSLLAVGELHVVGWTGYSRLAEPPPWSRSVPHYSACARRAA